MAAGTIATSVLTDIANAIRAQNGTATLYAPTAMASAVAALDGIDAGGAAEEGYLELESGLVDDSVFGSIAAAIRAQNGEETLYKPGDMAEAILALTWDTGIKARAILLSDGTLEFNYRDGRSTDYGLRIVNAWEVDAAGYSASADRPWEEDKLLVTRAAFDDDWAGAGVTNYAYWFLGCVNLLEVEGFEQLSGMTAATQMFVSCAALETIWATGFDSSGIEDAYMALYGCGRLVGGTGYVDSTTSSSDDTVALLTLGEAGLLTDPDDDAREWLYGWAYGDGELVVTAASDADSSRELLAGGRHCANARYDSSDAAPWLDAKASITQATLSEDLASYTHVNTSYWFYGCTAMEGVSGISNLPATQEMRFTFSSCNALTELDFRGFDNASLDDLDYTFNSCSGLTTIYADEDWELPSGLSGTATFYSCKALVGGNGTTYSSSRVSYRYMVIDSDSATGYLTAG